MFKGLPKVEEMYDGGYTAGGITQQGPFFTAWRPWFAWRPVRMLNGQLTRGRRIYRRAYEKTYVNHDDWTRYQYGSLLDVLKNEPTLSEGQVPPKPAPPFKGLQDG